MPTRSPASFQRTLVAGADAARQGIRTATRRTIPFVSLAPPKLGGGNYLYMFLHVWRLRRSGRRAWVVRQPAMAPWLEMFPQLIDLVIDATAIPRIAERRFQWYRAHREFNDVLGPFIDDVILSSPEFQARMIRAKHDLETRQLMINVRRGDYYSNSEFYRRFAVDHDYLFGLVQRDVLSLGSVDRILVVSDDPAWCKATMPEHFGGVPITAAPRKDLFDDLAHLSVAHRLVLSNSTFSYWGGYINERVHGNAGLRIWAPTFHERPISGPSLTGGRFDVVSPYWSQLDNAPHEMQRSLT